MEQQTPEQLESTTLGSGCMRGTCWLVWCAEATADASEKEPSSGDDKTCAIAPASRIFKLLHDTKRTCVHHTGHIRASTIVFALMRKLTAIFLLIVCLPIPSFAWGPEGYRVVDDFARAGLRLARMLKDALGK